MSFFCALVKEPTTLSCKCVTLVLDYLCNEGPSVTPQKKVNIKQPYRTSFLTPALYDCIIGLMCIMLLTTSPLVLGLYKHALGCLE